MPEKPLKKYKDKRQFDQTPEPKGGRPKADKLHFVIQKHEASRLHYDFRLELGGVLKSWAIPKGPTVDPAIKRLAMQVEDHPYDYKDFEGVIPKGNYGAGTVIIWDEGEYEPLGDTGLKNKKTKEKALLAGLKAGDLKFRLFGKKLQGEFALVKPRGGNIAENAWLLIKHKDEAVSKKDISKLDKSVVSGKSINQMKKEPDHTYVKGKRVTKSKKNAKSTTNKTPWSKQQSKATRNLITGEQSGATHKNGKSTNNLMMQWEEVIKKLPDSQMPTSIQPMLATLVDAPFDDQSWNFELKWDGYRMIAYVKVTGKNHPKTTVIMKSRNQKSFDKKYYPIRHALGEFTESMVLDGEVVVVNEAGMPQFGALQNWRSETDGTLLYYVFDLLWYNGKDLKSMPLTIRQAILNIVIQRQAVANIRLGFSLQGYGIDFMDSVKKLGIEGIVAKKRDSMYEQAHRSKSWLKIKVDQRQEVIIVGYTLNKGSSKQFSSLLLGVYKEGKLQFAGKVGTGFSDQERHELMTKFKKFVRKTSPLDQLPIMDKSSRFNPNPPGSVLTWLSPKLVAEVSYRERTKDGLFRHPSFKGLRTDKDPKEVVLEKKDITSKLLNKTNNKKDSDKKRAAKNKKGVGSTKKYQYSIMDTKNALQAKLAPPKSNSDDTTLLNPTNKTQVKLIDGNNLRFSNLDKTYWKKEKLCKRDLINYYYNISPFILPYLKKRPQSLNRFPDGIDKKNFYQKDVTGKVPDWVELYLYHSEGDKRDKHILVADGLASLLYMASLGCIEMNPWSSTIKKPDNPTWCIIDLDPDKHKKGQRAFEEVIIAARITHDVLTDLGVDCYPKTSGASGMHIYIPLGNKYSFEQSKLFAKLIVTMVQQQLPNLTTLERTVADRQGKLYLDFLQNRPQATIAAPYSVRPQPGATVSMPLDWSEVKPGLKREDYNIKNAVDRARQVGDLFKPVLGKGIDLKKLMKNFS